MSMVARRGGGGAQAADGGESKERVQQRYIVLQGCRKQGAGGQWPFQILIDHLSLFPSEGQIMPTPRFSDPPMALYCWLAGIMHRQRLNHSSHLKCPLSLLRFVLIENLPECNLKEIIIRPIGIVVVNSFQNTYISILNEKSIYIIFDHGDTFAVLGIS